MQGCLYPPCEAKGCQELSWELCHDSKRKSLLNSLMPSIVDGKLSQMQTLIPISHVGRNKMTQHTDASYIQCMHSRLNGSNVASPQYFEHYARSQKIIPRRITQPAASAQYITIGLPYPRCATNPRVANATHKCNCKSECSTCIDTRDSKVT